RNRPKGKVEIEIASIRFPSRDTAIEEGAAGVTEPDAGSPAPSRYVVLHVREGGQWRIALARGWGGRSDNLQDLAWLVGDWVAKSKDREMRLTFAWNPNKTFIENHYSVSEAGRPASSGTQHICKNARTGQICSWTFEEDGGRGQARWSR